MQRVLKRSEQVAREILRDVVDRGLPPDTPLPPESAMLQMYNVSRASLREGLRILEVHGIVALKPGPKGGPRVGHANALNFAHMSTLFYEANGATYEELARARLLLEPAVAGLAAVQRTEEHVALLESWMARQAAADPADPALALDLSHELHGIVAQACDNRVLNLMIASFEEVFSVYLDGGLTGDENAPVVKAHVKIARAIVDGDRQAAEDAMRSHMEAFSMDISERLPQLARKVVGWL